MNAPRMGWPVVESVLKSYRQNAPTSEQLVHVVLRFLSSFPCVRDGTGAVKVVLVFIFLVLLAKCSRSPRPGAGNEFSYFMLMVSNFVLNGVVEVRARRTC